MSKTIKSWRDVSINLYKEIADVWNDEGVTQAEKEIALISLLSGINESEVWNMPITEIEVLREQIKWANDFDFNKNIKCNKLNVGKYNLKAHFDVGRITYSQFVDFQALMSEDDKDLASIIACFFIPKGCKYNEGYDLAELIETINNELDIVTANEVCFFLFRRLANSIKGSLKSYMVKMKVMRKLMRMKPIERERMILMEENLKGLISTLG